MVRPRPALAAVAGAVALFVLVQVGALALVEPFAETPEYQFVQDEQDPTNSVLYVAFLLVVTALMLVVIRLDVQWLLRLVLVGASATVAWYVFAVVLAPLADALGADAGLVAGAAAAVLGVALLAYPEWYVVDATGVVMGAGAAALLGVNFGVLPAIVLLAVLAVYDAISVYRTEHMLTLASGVMELRVPVVLVVPLTLSYSFLEDDPGPDVDGEDDAGGGDGAAVDPGDAGEGAGEAPAGVGDRDAVFVGLGDAVMPTILAASAAVFVDAPALGIPGVSVNLPALTTVAGTLVGLVVLLRMVLAGRAHAGLPLLNGGAIGGYVLGALAAGVPLVEALGLGPYL